MLPAGQFDPAELDVVTTEPFGSGPVVELPCSGSVRGTRCVFRRDSIESTVRANHGKCPLCNESYGGLARGSQGSGQMSIRFDPGLQCSGFESGTYTIRYTFPDGTQSELMVRDFDWDLREIEPRFLFGLTFWGRLWTAEARLPLLGHQPRRLLP